MLKNPNSIIIYNLYLKIFEFAISFCIFTQTRESYTHLLGLKSFQITILIRHFTPGEIYKSGVCSPHCSYESLKFTTTT